LYEKSELDFKYAITYNGSNEQPFGFDGFTSEFIAWNSKLKQWEIKSRKFM